MITKDQLELRQEIFDNILAPKFNDKSTLRDFIAITAMGGFCAYGMCAPGSRPQALTECSEQAYLIADAMMRARMHTGHDDE